MIYNNIYKGTFLSRPNRFIAYVLINDKKEICHVKNTGRCRELLVIGATVFLEKNDNPNRKTMYDLVCVIKNNMLINMDSQAPNKVVYEWLLSEKCPIKNITYIKPECKHLNSRFDFYIETKTEKIFMEVKGVTLENDGVASFPDAPTLRGLKHIEELEKCVFEGYRAIIFFAVQMENVKCFVPNDKTQPDFGKELKNAFQNGVKIFCYDCKVTSDSLHIKEKVKFIL